MLFTCFHPVSNHLANDPVILVLIKLYMLYLLFIIKISLMGSLINSSSSSRSHIITHSALCSPDHFTCFCFFPACTCTNLYSYTLICFFIHLLDLLITNIDLMSSFTRVSSMHLSVRPWRFEVQRNIQGLRVCLDAVRTREVTWSVFSFRVDSTSRWSWHFYYQY